jgi:TnpA family transposase
VLEQQTELKPTQIMTDTGAYSDVVFGLFRLLARLRGFGAQKIIFAT